MAITIIFAPPRFGKTALMAFLLSVEMFNYERIKACKEEIKAFNYGGFKLTYPGYITACNFDLEGHKFGYSVRFAKRINPYRLGFLNENVKTHFLPPYCAIGICEGQKYLNSRMFKYFPDWQSRFYEMHGHNYYDIYIDTQRPDLIDVNVRQLSSFIEVISMIKDYKREKVIWNVRRINDSYALDKYLNGGRIDKSLYVEEKIVAPIEVLSWYKTREAKPLFYNGKFKKDFDRLNHKVFKLTLEDVEAYCYRYGKELPDKFYDK